MSSSVPPNPWYNGIIYNPAFFTANTDTITIAYANATYLRRIGNPTSIATLTTFTGSVSIQGSLQFVDATSMNSAYTGAGALMGSYTSANLTINGNGKITAISNGSGATLNLSQVLLNGNSAGATSINMNNNDITNGKVINGTSLLLNGGSAYIESTSTTGNLTIQTNNASTGSIAFNVNGLGAMTINNLGTVNIQLKLTTTDLRVNGTYFGNGGNTSAIQIGDTDLALVNNNSIQIGRGANLGATSSHNVAIGNYANSAGNNTGNTVLGSYALTNCSGGSFNTIIGREAGNTIFSGSNYTCLGYGAIAGDNLTYATAIGAGSYCPTSNTIALGRNTGEDNVLIYSDLILQTTQPTNTAGYLGYNNEIFATNIGAITSGVIFNNITAGFSLTAGVYLFNICIYDVKTVAGRLTTLQTGISTSSTSQVGGFSNYVFGHMDYTGGATNDVIGNISYTFSVPSTATYYFLQLSTNTIALTNTAETFIQYTRIA
jgi:hypothetical protein